MREILFRGKPKNQNEFYHFSNVWRDCIKDGFVLGSLIVSGNRYYICVSMIGANKSAINNGTVSMIEVIPETIGQHTGLTDKNGTKIFEWDIVRYADIDEYQYYLDCQKSPDDYDKNLFENMWTVGYIKYGNKFGYPAFDLNIHDFECNALSELHESHQYYYKVIGNIHDNPELLKEADNE